MKNQLEKFEALGIPLDAERRSEQAVYGIALLYNLLHSKISEYLKQYNLTGGKFNVLLAIKVQGGDQGMSQVEISKRLIVTPANMTKLIDKLEKDKLVTRHAQAGDRRIKIIRVTTLGKNLLDDLWPGYLSLLEEATAPLNQKEKDIFAAIALKWVGQMIED